MVNKETSDASELTEKEVKMMYLVLAIFTFISASVSLGYALQASISSRNINAYYAFTRSFPIWLLSILTLIIYNHTFLLTISILMITIQFLDSIIGLINNDKLKFYGPLLTSIINLLLLILFIIIN